MSKTKFLKGECTQCGGRLEFPAESAGQTTTCPHCGQTTELFLYTPPAQPTIPRRTIIWTLIAVVVLLVGLAGAFLLLGEARKKLAKLMPPGGNPASATNAASGATNTPAAKADAAPNLAGFRASEVRLEKTTGSSLVYAVGSLTNTTGRQRFGVRVTLDLFDSDGKQLGTATDYQAGMEPRAAWDFKAMVVDKNAAKAQIASVTEQK